MSNLRRFTKYLNIRSRKNTMGKRADAPPSFHVDALEARLLLSVVGGATPTVDLTNRLNGASDGDPQLNTAIVVNGALYTNDIDIANIGAGSGILDSFVRISDNTTMVQGYNTSGRPVQFQENTSAEFTHDMPLVAIPWIFFDTDNDGTKEAYREFRLDINENNTDAERWLSLDALQIWQSDTMGLHSGFVPAGADTDQASPAGKGFAGVTDNYLAYSLDSGNAGNWVALNYALNPGSGVADMVLLIPSEYFDPDLEYVYLYSQFGNQAGTSDIAWDKNGDFINDQTLYNRTWGQSDGYEEWAVAPATPAEKSGVKFHDLDGDGVRDAGEPGLAGWTIYVYEDKNEDGTLDAGEELVKSVLTANGTTDDLNGDGVIDPVGFYWFELSGISYRKVQGNYVFAGGHYIVLEEARAGWSQSAPATDVVDTGSAPGATQFGYAIELTPGEQDTGNDFGNYELATKSGLKYEDLNANGSKDGGEVGQADWWIYAYNDVNGNGLLDAGDTLAASVQTADGTTDNLDGVGGIDPVGFYWFSLKPGKYIVVEEDRSGWLQSQPLTDVDGHVKSRAENGYAITLTSGQVDSDNLFGNYRNATKSGLKYKDLNANGSKDGGEVGQADWWIYAYNDVNGNGLLDAGDTLAASVQTADGTTDDLDGVGGIDPVGFYWFSLKPGKYIVVEEDRSGWLQSQPLTDVDGHVKSRAENGYAITLTSGQVDSDNVFGNFQQATKSGTKFHDLNANGVKDAGEPGLSGWTINLVGTDGMGNPVNLSTTTDGSGNYSFTVNPGVYTVSEVLQANWFQSYPDIPGDGDWDIVLTSGQTDSGNDFGNFQQATKSGTKFHDLDADGVKDAGEPGLSGWTINLVGTDGQGHAVNLSTTTDGSGNYSFTVNPGSYTVSEVLQANWFQSYPDIPGDGDWDIVLTSGQTDSGNDFGNFQQATKSGTKFHDLDADGVKDAGEPGLSGWTINLVGTDGMGNAVNLSTTTDGSGNYSFTVNPGVYTVSEVLQANWFQSYPDIPGDGDWDIVLTSGQTDSGNDFGNYLNGSIHGFKFEDLDADGIKDGGEVGMADITIRLTGDIDGDGDTETLSTTTDADGYFSFTGLHPGDYTVTEQFTPGNTRWGATVDHDGNGIGDNTSDVTVQSGEELVAFTGLAGLGVDDPRHEVLVNYDLIFGNHALGAVGLTPGFWYNHLYVWDGVADNGPQDGQGRCLAQKLADDGVIEAPEILNLLPGSVDVDTDGKKDLVFDDRLVIQWDDAREIVGMANGTGGDKLGDFVRYAITTLLNDIGVPDFGAPSDLLHDIADWLITYGPTTVVGGRYVLRYNNLIEPNQGQPGYNSQQDGPRNGFPAGSAIRANSAAWRTGGGDVPAGSEIFAAMNGLTDAAYGGALAVSLNGSFVFTGVNYGSYFGIRTGTQNLTDGYLLLL